MMHLPSVDETFYEEQSAKRRSRTTQFNRPFDSNVQRQKPPRPTFVPVQEPLPPVTPSQAILAREHAERMARLFPPQNTKRLPPEETKPEEVGCGPEPHPFEPPPPVIIPPVVDEVAELEHALVRTEARRLSVKDIQQAVCRYFGVMLPDLRSARRTRSVVRPRHVAMYLAKLLTLRSLPEIGRRFGGKDHTTVLHAVRKIESLIPIDPDLAADIEAVKAMLRAAG